jgi:hypothetical protein
VSMLLRFYAGETHQGVSGRPGDGFGGGVDLVPRGACSTAVLALASPPCAEWGAQAAARALKPCLPPLGPSSFQRAIFRRRNLAPFAVRPLDGRGHKEVRPDLHSQREEGAGPTSGSLRPCLALP